MGHIQIEIHTVNPVPVPICGTIVEDEVLVMLMVPILIHRSTNVIKLESIPVGCALPACQLQRPRDVGDGKGILK